MTSARIKGHKRTRDGHAKITYFAYHVSVIAVLRKILSQCVTARTKTFARTGKTHMTIFRVWAASVFEFNVLCRFSSSMRYFVFQARGVIKAIKCLAGDPRRHVRAAELFKAKEWRNVGPNALSVARVDKQRKMCY